ncbi:MAG: hypothetical protein OXH32_16740 [Acidobacteria bacterium]|nr:hypothetical protein [Acidobacteriota bacterium]
MTLDWHNIRPLNGGRDKGFEELCAQLARFERPSGSEFVRKGAPDAGVECYAILSDGTEWAWQSKYVFKLEDSQWSQIDRSIKRALAKHPRLVRYVVCVPVDRPDARIDGQKSAKEKWDHRVLKWDKWACERGMTVDFVYWGSHELLERLARPEHVGRAKFWFDAPGFDAAWFKARLDEALKTAGPRYTPELHLDLPIAWEFEAFGRTADFFDREKARARGIRAAARAVEHPRSAEDEAVDAALATVASATQAVLAAIAAIDPRATGPLPFGFISELVEAAEEAVEELSRLLTERERGWDSEARARDPNARRSSYVRNPFRDQRFRLARLVSELEEARHSFARADRVSASSLMVVLGSAGTGKTHLLCDVARRRVSTGRPTVLLMGQRFIKPDEPWSQALQQMDLPGLSAEEFVGALEAAAQAAGARALVMVDGLNEGAGRDIWPSQLPSFLARLESSPWIGVVLTVRSAFEELVLPEDVRSRAAVVTHSGFEGREYDAVKTFFVHYDLELPSTPLLAPEFRNPLFLKALCQGLSSKGERRLPRGSQGISDIFDLYLSGINERLASSLDFDSRTSLVRRAVEAVAEGMLEQDGYWLPLSKAQELVNCLLPGRDFSRSLYHGLVVEGVLVEGIAPLREPKPEVVVLMAYERLADHVAARGLVRRHVDINDPAAAFTATGSLAFLGDGNRYVSPGLLEALCIEIPEQTGQEIVSIAPGLANQWGLADAFRQSLVWRSCAAFSDDTLQVLNEFVRNEHDWHDTLDVLLTVATVPEHPLNAHFLDRRLRSDSMPDRDAWWSVYLHHAYQAQGPADRLVDWASSVTPEKPVDDEAVELCAVTLAWIFTTPNRFLRDRATAALVDLLSGRLKAVVRLVERFADVDDPYVAERVYAVAYGVAMRCHDAAAVGALAMCVYERVFAAGNPPPHILLRDYARGVVERALSLGSEIEVVVDRVRPPYKSTWPGIPTEEEVEPLQPDWSTGSHDSGSHEWARNRIGRSVMSDDFARYVIGTNWSGSDWLALRLDEPEWKPKTTAARRYDQHRPPRFDLAEIQRYVLWRVFNMGWTTERFGRFDRFSIGFRGRDAWKAERIGKKYQWIAYHEIMALVSDHHQYLERSREDEGDTAYEGPWQGRFRDIDPSCTLRSVPGGTSWDGHAVSWWATTQYDSWGDPESPLDWIVRTEDLPAVEDLLVVTGPEDDSRWLNAQGYFCWCQRRADSVSTETETRDLAYVWTGYLIREDEAQAFLEWAKEVDFARDRAPEPPGPHHMFLGEHAWSPACQYYQQPYYGDDGWSQPANSCPAELRAVTREYLREVGNFDCSIDDTYTLRLPGVHLVRGLGLRWTGHGADFADGSGRIVAQDPTVHSEGPSSMLFREDVLREFLAREKLTICWAVLGERRVIAGGFGPRAHYPWLRLSGAYVLSRGRAEGFLKYMIDEPSGEDDGVAGSRVLSTRRTGE